MATLSTVTSALERCYSAVRAIHPEVRPAVMCIYLHPAGDKLGHYWQSSWTTRDDRLVDEIHISSAVLHAGAAATFAVLLHEAVHSLAVARGIQDVSRQGRYHNSVFHDLAVELGLEVVKVKGLGWTTPDCLPQTKELFFNALLDLAESIELWQRLGSRDRGGSGKGSRNLKATCPACKRIIRVSMKVWEQGAIKCVPCTFDFELV